MKRKSIKILAGGVIVLTFAIWLFAICLSSGAENAMSVCLPFAFMFGFAFVVFILSNTMSPKPKWDIMVKVYKFMNVVAVAIFAGVLYLMIHAYEKEPFIIPLVLSTILVI